MSLKAGIIGLPNVGKSTLFSAITNSQVEIANYPFATIDANLSTVSLEDKRLDFLEKYFSAKNKVYNTFTFVDIAGIVKGASKGEGLGNKFLSNIREVDLLIHVVRGFESKDIIHVSNQVNPVDDVEIINTELILADYEISTKRLQKIEKKALTTKDKDLLAELDFLQKINHCLETEKLIFDQFENNQDIIYYAKRLGLITAKKTIYVLNIAEDKISDFKNDSFYQKLKSALGEKEIILPISAKIEKEISEFDNQEEKQIFLNDLGLEESGLNKITKQAMLNLNLGNFFTAGEKEVRAWTFKKEDKVKESAGIIHSDISRGFIAAEIYSVSDLIQENSLAKLKTLGKIRTEGKNYTLQEGDVCNFRFKV